MRHSDLFSSEECEMELNGALNRAEHLRQRGRQVLNDAENEIVELQNQSKKSMDEVEVTAAAVIDMALAENDGTIREIVQLQAVTMISLAESDYRESRICIDHLWDFSQQNIKNFRDKITLSLLEKRLCF